MAIGDGARACRTRRAKPVGFLCRDRSEFVSARGGEAGSAPDAWQPVRFSRYFLRHVSGA